MKTRLDKLLVTRGLAASRERAQALILAGKVLVDEQKIEKAGINVAEDAALRLLGEDLRYVSRGGLKLEHALEHWKIDVTGKTCLDIGASTGGFTDCLLQHGASRVIAVDTGYGQIAMKLRQDTRVTLIEKCNARLLTRQALVEQAGSDGTVLTIDLIAMDVSFISATLVLPAVIASAFSQELPELNGKSLVILVKPQFEVGRNAVSKGGIVRDETEQLGAVEKVRRAVIALGYGKTDVNESPILGVEGNREFLLYAQFGSS